eukprot:364271-Chlamydomonas_euryale.AAC.9
MAAAPAARLTPPCSVLAPPATEFDETPGGELKQPSRAPASSSRPLAKLPSGLWEAQALGAMGGRSRA